jgi:hypothetical protein
MRLSDAYSSERRFTKSTKRPSTFTVAVSKCFDCSGFASMTPILDVGSCSVVVRNWFRYVANCTPVCVSSAMSTSWHSLPSSCSTQPRDTT